MAKRYSKTKGTQGAASPNSPTPANLPRTTSSNPQAGMKQLISPTKPTVQVSSGIWNPTGKPFPDMMDVSETTPPLETIGATGVAIFSGIITSEEYNPDFNWRDATKIYEQMLRNDSQIAAIREMVELPIRRTKWSIVPASDDPRDKEIASFVESCLFHDNCYITTEGRKLTQKWDDLLRHMLMHIWYGYMAFEQNFRVEDGWVKWAHFTPLLPRTVWRWWVGEDNELTGIQQWTYKGYNYQFVNIPADKLLLFSHRQEGNNYEGVAALRQIYKNWFYKVQYEKIDAIGIERNAIVPPVITLPENFTSNDAAMALQIVQNLRANELMGVTLPPGWVLEYPKNMQKYAADAMTAIKYHDTLMARRLLCQFLNLGSDETGTYALADTQVQTFLSSLQGEAEYVEDVFNSDAIPRLVDYNFDDVAVYPTLKCARIQGDITVIGTALKDVLGQNPLLQPYPELQSWYADLLGIPTPPADLIQTTNPTSPTNSDQPDKQQPEANAEPKNVQGIQSKDQSGQAMAEMTQQVMLLNESIRAIDAVGRGKAHLMLYNPNHLPAGPGGGEFAPKGGGAGSAGGDAKGEHLRARAAAAHAAHAKAKAAYTKAVASGKGEAIDKALVKQVSSSERASRAESAYRTHVAKSGSGEHAASHSESIHEKSARLQREQNLPPEVRPTGNEASLHPVNQIEGLRIDPAAKVDANFLHHIYGDAQMGAALHGYSRAKLQEAAESVGIKPGRTNEETISRITAKVTEGRYSANFGKSEGEAKSASKASSRSESIHESRSERNARLQQEHFDRMDAFSRDLAHVDETQGHDATFNPRRIWDSLHGDPAAVHEALATGPRAYIDYIVRHPDFPPGFKERSGISRDTYARDVVAHLDKAYNGEKATFKSGKELAASKASSHSKSTDARLSRLESQHEELMAAHKALMAEHKAQAQELARVKAENARLKAKGEGKAKSSGKTRQSQSERDRNITKDDGLKVINHGVEHKFDPHANPDAHFLHQQYGTHQLKAALARYPHSALRGTAQDNGLKAGRTKEETIQRIYNHMVETEGVVE